MSGGGGGMGITSTSAADFNQWLHAMRMVVSTIQLITWKFPPFNLSRPHSNQSTSGAFTWRCTARVS